MEQSSRRRVLIVEDEVMVAMLLQEMISDLGHDVVGPASTIETGLQLARQELFDCAILDMNLGNGVSSTPVAIALKLRGIPFMFSTGYDRDDTREFDDVPRLHKPYGPADLEEALGRLLSRTDLLAADGRERQRVLHGAAHQK